MAQAEYISKLLCSGKFYKRTYRAKQPNRPHRKFVVRLFLCSLGGFFRANTALNEDYCTKQLQCVPSFPCNYDPLVVCPVINAL